MKKILLIANRDFVLYNFRFELIEKLISEGYKVYIALPYGPKVELMVKVGAEFLPINVDGRGKNLFKDVALIHDLVNVFKKTTPDIALMYTTKVNLYGAMVAKRFGTHYLLNVSGLGTAATNGGLLQKIVISLYRMAVKNADCVFFQNEYNREFFDDYKIKCRKEYLIPGSGVNLNNWEYMEYPHETNGIHFLFIARIIKEKGIEEYLSAAKYFAKRNNNTFFHVIGPCDGNYNEMLNKYNDEGTISYHGLVEDTRKYLKFAHCLIHPSYYPEGISNVCLEAASSGRPVITTDNHGCKETVEDKVSGFIIRTIDEDSLICSINDFLSLSWSEKREMGLNGRKKVEKEFDRNVVTEKYITEIKDILG